jgi:hypothetical protein
MKKLTFNDKVFSQYLFFTMYLSNNLYFHLSLIYNNQFRLFFEYDLNDILDFNEDGHRIHYI